MEFRTDLLCICLVILHFFNFGEALSGDESGESVGEEKHRWTLAEEAKLIFFDVLTDTGEQGHFERIKQEWHKEYPNLNLTDYALRNKIYKLRRESVGEEEGKAYFKWNSELDRELMDLYLTTRPYVRNANITLEDGWKKRHPNCRVQGKSLQWRALQLLKKCNYMKYKTRGSSETLSHGEGKEIVLNTKHHWTKEEKAAILHFYKLTDTKEPGHFERMKWMWRKEFPNSELSDRALHTMVYRLRRNSRKGVSEGEHGDHRRWNSEEERMLLDTYLNTYPYRKDVNITFREAWKQRQKNSPIRRGHLTTRARKLLQANKYPEYSAQALSNTNFQSDNLAGHKPLYIKRHKSEEYRDVPLEELGEGTSRMRRQKQNRYQTGRKSVDEHLRGWEAARSGKRADKAPKVYDSDASTSSPPTMSQNSE